MKNLVLSVKENYLVMITLSSLVLVGMFEYMYQCRSIYLHVTCLYVGYICMLIFPVEDHVTLRFDCYKA